MIIEKARQLRKLIADFAMKSEDKTLVIGFKDYFEAWKPDVYKVGDIRIDSNGCPKECMIAHDSTVNTSWTIDVASLWKPYHSRMKEYALPYVAPTGAHDIYKVGEYAVWTDGKVYKCITDTNFNPAEHSQAWKVEE